MKPPETPLERLIEAERQIAWVLAHPGMSAWLKRALRTAVDRDPVDILNDLEMLNLLLQSRSQAEIDQSLSQYGRQFRGRPRQKTD